MKNILTILNPQPVIGGLELNDFEIKYVAMQGGRVIARAVALEKGVIEDGCVKDKAKCKAALEQLHAKITAHRNKKVYAIVNITDNNAYTQIFALPMAAVGDLQESARLNLQMISPIDFKNAYADWQKAGENEKNGGQLEILGAFAQKQTIDDIIECAKEKNFVPVAVEFASLALARIVAEKGLVKKTGEKITANNYVVINFDSRGLSVGFIKSNNLYFNHFVKWPLRDDHYITIGEFKDMLIRETKKMINFVITHWSQSLNTVFYINRIEELEPEIDEIMKKSLGVARAEEIVIAKNVGVAAEFINCAGSALRGGIARVNDVFISLTSVGTEDEFRQYRILNFIRIWRNITMVTLIFLAIIFGAATFFLGNTVATLEARKSNASSVGKEDLAALSKEVEAINTQIALALAGSAERSQVVPVVEIVQKAAEGKVTIGRMFMQAKEAPIIIRADTMREEAILEFKRSLEAQPQFESVEYNLSQITELPNGGKQFVMTVTLKKDAKFEGE